MAKNETLHIRVNDGVKAAAEQTLERLGLSVSEAVNIFLCQVNLCGGLPFEVRLPVPERVIVRSKEDLQRKLQEGEEDIKAGRVTAAEEVFEELESKYGV